MIYQLQQKDDFQILLLIIAYTRVFESLMQKDWSEKHILPSKKCRISLMWNLMVTLD